MPYSSATQRKESAWPLVGFANDVHVAAWDAGRMAGRNAMQRTRRVHPHDQRVGPVGDRPRHLEIAADQLMPVVEMHGRRIVPVKLELATRGVIAFFPEIEQAGEQFEFAVDMRRPNRRFLQDWTVAAELNIELH